jgi:hypothetical protein
LDRNYWADVLFSTELTNSPFALVIQVQDNGAGYLSNQAIVTVNLVPILKDHSADLDIYIENTFNNEVNIYPNPVTNRILNVQLDGQIQQDFDLTICDLSGRILFRHHFIQQNNIPLNLSEFSRGMYILLINSNNYKSTSKFVVY